MTQLTLPGEMAPKAPADQTSQTGQTSQTSQTYQAGQAKRQAKTANLKLYSEQPVYVCSYTLLKELTVCYRSIPRDLRYTIGSRMLQNITDEVMSVAHAFKSPKGKDEFIWQALLRMQEVQVCLRLLRDVDAISTKYFLHTLPLTSNVTAQLTSWYRYAKRREAGAGSGSDSFVR